jgi:hypothetical protein
MKRILLLLVGLLFLAVAANAQDVSTAVAQAAQSIPLPEASTVSTGMTAIQLALMAFVLQQVRSMNANKPEPNPQVQTVPPVPSEHSGGWLMTILETISNGQNDQREDLRDFRKEVRQGFTEMRTDVRGLDVRMARQEQRITGETKRI